MSGEAGLVAALYDVHGNLPALAAVLEDARFGAAARVVVGGDVVAGPQPREVLDALLALPAASFVRGNGDRWVTGVGEPDVPPALVEETRWCAGRLDDDARALVRAWPASTMLDVPGLGEVLFCHATPGSDLTLLTPGTPDADVAAELEGTPQPVVVCGHIHVAYERRVGAQLVVNPGSVGRPNERPPGAYWALLGGEPAVQLLHTPYDVERTIAAAAAAGYPAAGLAEALREPPDAQATIAFFEERRGG
jgi:predicted phosphodiesterase